MSETKPDLTSLRIDRDARPTSSGHGKLLAGLAAGIVLLAGGGWALSRATRVVEVEVAVVRGMSGGAPAVLNASGYVTARRKATVAAKITGRVADIRVEEGMPVKEGPDPGAPGRLRVEGAARRGAGPSTASPRVRSRSPSST